MKIQGKLIEELAVVTGESKKGEWKKQGFVFKIPGEYPKKVCVINWNDKVGTLEVGADYSIGIDIQSREYEGKWYTDVVMFGARKL